MDSRTKGPDFQQTHLHEIRLFSNEHRNGPFPIAGRGPINEETHRSSDISVGIAEPARFERRGTMKPGRFLSVWCLSIATLMLPWTPHPAAAAGPSPADVAAARRGEEALTQHSYLRAEWSIDAYKK